MAALIDGVLLNVIGFMGAFGIVAIFGAAMGGGEDAEVLAGLIAYLFFILTGWFYFAGMECSHYQATLGKLALNIYVCDMDGNRVSFLRATGRHFGKMVSTLILFVGYLMAAFTKQKQALHHKMAGCLVLR